ncbi:acetyl esterase/lipase [Antricoccus suffuscus]|uniref:Acetyl esterase/lipase n=1 Tax=Antricoccus suffuscus TaxID=1629062 RepID=A0A2T0ZS95_9ACTN|nr:acetyl esterase/lipase [Antricoccus suffuscus]
MRIIIWIVSILLTIVVGVAAALTLSPWPGALLVRALFSIGGSKMSSALEKHVPGGVTSMLNQQYGADGPDTTLDVFFPTKIKDTSAALPTVVWIHGGGWVAGDKSEIANYLKILASKGYTVVGPNYSIAPGEQYPTPIVQVMQALAYVQKNAAKLHIDPTQIVLAGDSAGAQIASQVAAITTNDEYADLVGIGSTLNPDNLVGTVLNCGAYDAHAFNLNTGGIAGVFIRTVVWSYLGSRNPSQAKLTEMSVVDNVDGQFPPTYISGGNADPLTPQGKEMAKKLQSLGVSVDSLFYPADYTPKLPHEYQFNLDDSAGQNALDRTVAFLEAHTSNQ